MNNLLIASMRVNSMCFLKYLKWTNLEGNGWKEVSVQTLGQAREPTIINLKELVCIHVGSNSKGQQQYLMV